MQSVVSYASNVPGNKVMLVTMNQECYEVQGDRKTVLELKVWFGHFKVLNVFLTIYFPHLSLLVDLQFTQTEYQLFPVHTLCFLTFLHLLRWFRLPECLSPAFVPFHSPFYLMYQSEYRILQKASSELTPCCGLYFPWRCHLLIRGS